MTETPSPSDSFSRGASGSYGLAPQEVPPPRQHSNLEQNEQQDYTIDTDKDDQLLNADERNVFSSFLYSLEQSDSDFLQPPSIQQHQMAQPPPLPSSSISVPPPSLSPTSPKLYSSSTASFSNVSPSAAPDDPNAMFVYNPAIVSAVNFSSIPMPREEGPSHSHLFANSLTSAVDPAATTALSHDKTSTHPIHLVPSTRSHMRSNSFEGVSFSSPTPKYDPTLMSNINYQQQQQHHHHHHHHHHRPHQPHHPLPRNVPTYQQYSPTMGPPMHMSNGTAAPYSFETQHDDEDQKPLNTDSLQVNTYKRPLLTSAEKRSNHILSEQKRRDAIRLGFKDLVELLQAGEPVSGINVNGPSPTSPTSASKSPVDQRANSSNSVKLRGRGRGRKGDASAGASKSALLGQGVRYIKWLERGNYALEIELQRCREILHHSSTSPTME